MQAGELTPENTATVTMTNRLTGATESESCISNVRMTAYAILRFAKRQDITPELVNYTIEGTGLYPTS